MYGCLYMYKNLCRQCVCVCVCVCTCVCVCVCVRERERELAMENKLLSTHTCKLIRTKNIK